MVTKHSERDQAACLVPTESSFFLQSHRPHAYRAVGDVEYRVVWINTPPTF
jgi:hypothetical protein